MSFNLSIKDTRDQKDRRIAELEAALRDAVVTIQDLMTDEDREDPDALYGLWSAKSALGHYRMVPAGDLPPGAWE